METDPGGRYLFLFFFKWLLIEVQFPGKEQDTFIDWNV